MRRLLRHRRHARRRPAHRRDRRHLVPDLDVRRPPPRHGPLSPSLELTLSRLNSIRYVIVDFEHCLANHFFFAAAVFSGGAFEMDDLKQNLIFSTLGNAIGAALVAGLLLPISCNPKKIDEQISA